MEVQAERAIENTGALGLSQTIDWADKREARTKVASYVWVATRAKLVTVRQRLSGELLSALVRLQTARALARLAQRRADVTQRLAALSQQRYQAGDLNQVSLELARLAQAQAKLQRAQSVSPRHADFVSGGYGSPAEIKEQVMNIGALLVNPSYQYLICVAAANTCFPR
ncbi:MAG TPA: TolC family protein, partial [Gammaproteobacteria bacterium]|nr:TolC family protein [Gammaproteobacteria bacterium]